MIPEGCNWYTYTIQDIANPKVIFSDNGSNQTESEIEITGEKWYLNGTLYDSEPEGITVHFNNYDNWDNVNLYYYDGEKTSSDWTGNPMSSDGDGWYTYKIYGFDSVKVLFNNGGNIQIPDRLEPGFDVSGEMWYRNGEWTTERPAGIKIFFYSPENWGTPNIYYYKNDNDTGPAWPGEQMEAEQDNWYSFTITKYDEAKVLFNSASNQIPAQNQPGFDVTGIMWYKDGVLCDSESDLDNDDLPDFMEMLIGTNPNNCDSDGDGLPDGMEFYILGTDPLKADSDENGVNDGAEDEDNDGLTNYQEYTLGTNPTSADSDGDGLNDGEEVNTYHTDPMKADTDDDGLSDYNEIQNDFDPLVFNDSFDFALSCEGSEVTASVSIEGLPGEQAESLAIEPVEDYILLDNRIPGYIDCAFDFSVSGNFDTATISFEFDEILLNNESFVPRIYYFNEQMQTLEELDNQTVRGNTVSVETSHFSKYILLNKTAFDSVWDHDIKPPINHTDYSGIDVVFVIDSSGSMRGNDSNNLRLDAAESFVNKLGTNDRAAVIDFNGSANLRQGFTNNHSSLQSAIQLIGNKGSSTSLSAGISKAISQFTDSSYTRNDAYKYIIFLTDGIGDYDPDYTAQASADNITIYSIGLGNSVNSNLLTSIATGTGGKYYFASTADYLQEIYDDISVDTIDYMKDSNGDGISDYYTKLICEGRCVSGTGINLCRGISFSDFQANDDYDGDGIKNGDEAIVSLRSDGLVYIYFKSDPCSMDSDNDSYDDKADIDPLWFDEINGLLYQSKFKIGLDKQNVNIADDLKTNDYSSDDMISISNLFQNEIIDSEEILYAKFKGLMKMFAISKDSNVMVNDLINTFINGADDSIDVKTENGVVSLPCYTSGSLRGKVYLDSQVQDYLNTVVGEFSAEIVRRNGDIIGTNRSIQSIIENSGTSNIVFSRDTPEYLLGGMTLSINQLWGSSVDISNFEVDGNSYSGVLHFRLYDHFGLDEPDVRKVYVNLAGFRAWFVLQHYNQFNGKYHPFINVFDYYVPIAGDLN